MKKLKENDIAGDMCLSEKSFMSQNFENYGGPFEKPKKIMMQNNSKQILSNTGFQSTEVIENQI